MAAKGKHDSAALKSCIAASTSGQGSIIKQSKAQMGSRLSSANSPSHTAAPCSLRSALMMVSQTALIGHATGRWAWLCRQLGCRQEAVAIRHMQYAQGVAKVQCGADPVLEVLLERLRCLAEGGCRFSSS